MLLCLCLPYTLGSFWISYIKIFSCGSPCCNSNAICICTASFPCTIALLLSKAIVQVTLLMSHLSRFQKGKQAKRSNICPYKHTKLRFMVQ